jgi:hypothetical protein
MYAEKGYHRTSPDIRSAIGCNGVKEKHVGFNGHIQYVIEL